MIQDEILKEIDKIILEKPLIIVEGKKDRIALQSLGLRNIITLEKNALFEIVEYVVDSKENCVILTDLDSEGKKLYSFLYKNLQYFGVKVNNRLRLLLFKSPVRQIEALSNYLDHIRKLDKGGSNGFELR